MISLMKTRVNDPFSTHCSHKMKIKKAYDSLHIVTQTTYFVGLVIEGGLP